MATKNGTENGAVSANIEMCKALLGKHPDDVLMPMKAASDTLSWLEELFKTIAADALDAREGYRIKHLAEAGAYIACDFANFVGAEHESMRDHLRDANEGVA